MTYNYLEDKPSEYNKKTLIIDADTMLIRAALACQESYVEVTHIDSGRTKVFKNITEFQGRKKDHSDKCWLSDTNKERVEKGLQPFSLNQFSIEKKVKVVEPDHVGFGRMKSQIKNLTKQPWVKDYILVIGGKGNYRYNIAQIREYKGNRVEKPLRFDVIKEWTVNTYKDVLRQEDDVEADDVVGWFAHVGKLYADSNGTNPYVIGYVDKDLLQLQGWFCNYFDDKYELKYIDSFSGAKNFFTQMLIGDNTDNILGLPDLSNTTKSKYSLTKKKGCGIKSAEKIFNDCNNTLDLIKRVVECYKEYYGVEFFDFTNYEGRVWKRNYLSMLDENAKLLRMQTWKGQEYSLAELILERGIIGGSS